MLRANVVTVMARSPLKL